MHIKSTDHEMNLYLLAWKHVIIKKKQITHYPLLMTLLLDHRYYTSSTSINECKKKFSHILQIKNSTMQRRNRIKTRIKSEVFPLK